MANFPIYHGITLADNSFIENINLEILIADPVPVNAGRIWYNSTTKAFKFSSLDATGGVIVRQVATKEELDAALASLNSDLSAAISAESARATAAEAQALVDAKAYTDTTDAARKSYVDLQIQNLIGGAPAVLDTLKELADAFQNNPNILQAIQDTINSRIDGVVTSINNEATARTAADSALDTRITTLESNVGGSIGNFADLHTTNKTTIVAAINEVKDEVGAEKTRAQAQEATLQSNIDAEQLARTNGDAAIRSDYNARRYTEQTATAATVHTIAHNLNSAFVNFTVLVERADGKYRNDVVSVEEVDNNTLKVYLSVATRIKMSVESMVAL